MILSVPEGHDKPLKYPGIFQAAKAIILNKVDTMPVFNFDEQQFRADVASLNPLAPVFSVAAAGQQAGGGIAAWIEWLEGQLRIEN